MFAAKLRLRRAWAKRVLAIRSLYKWGNYDVSAGECCKMRDQETTECAAPKDVFPPKPMKCFHAPSFYRERYPVYLQEIYQRGFKPDPDCRIKLVRHDDNYKPSDKCRKMQRTWPECPLIWLRPKDTCCPDPETVPPSERRVRPPPRPPMTAIEKHLFHMNLLCKSVRMAGCKTVGMAGCKSHRSSATCKRRREPSTCTKTPAPFSSFSEVCRNMVPNNCPQECSCHTKPSICDMWSKYHKNRKSLKMCTKPLIGYRPRMRFPF